AGLEGLLELADLGVLEVPDLGREALQRAAGDGNRGEERGVPVALDDLGAHGVDGEPELGEDVGLDLRIELAVRPDRTADLAGRHVRHRGSEAAPIAIDLERPAGEL